MGRGVPHALRWDSSAMCCSRTFAGAAGGRRGCSGAVCGTRCYRNGAGQRVTKVEAGTGKPRLELPCPVDDEEDGAT